jgi:prepilin-type processing-associated H-X9-DG protein
MELPTAPPYQPPYAPPRKGVPAWVWILLGCGCFGFFGFIAFIAAILFPVFAQAREAAREQSCLSNLKQQALGTLMYAQDYDERFPPKEQWMDVLNPYTNTETILYCPSDPKEPQNYGYAFDSRMSLIKQDNIPSPRQASLLFDSSNLSRNASDPMTSLPSPGRHRQGNNMAYADGHVKNTHHSSRSGSPGVGGESLNTEGAGGAE